MFLYDKQIQIEGVRTLITYNDKTNLLELRRYKYSLQDIPEPNLYRDNYSYDEVPKVTFNYRQVPMNVPEEIWLTDTTFRDGQQSRAPYTAKQIATLYDMLHRLGGPKGKIRQCEFFLYSENDRRAIEACRELGYEFPEITGWIRATKEDFKLVKEMGMPECGILVSCSDYHIFNKLHKTRKQAIDGYLEIVEAALDMGITPRCHFEDVTRADFYGCVVPFATELKKLMDKYQLPVKIRFCDTMGYGVPYPGATLPRSVGGIIYGVNHFAQIPSELLEWHGHNDFYKVAVALCGCHDNRMDKIWWNEQWMGYPIDASYSTSSNVDNAYRLKGKLLLINGELDDNVDPASTLQVVSALMKANKNFEQLYLPGKTHSLGGPFEMHKMHDFFVKNLLGQEPPEWE